MAFSTLTLLGSTGSIGTQTLEVVRRFKDQIRVVGLSASGRRLELLAAQAIEFQPELLHIADASLEATLRTLLGGKWSGIILSGSEGLNQLAAEAPAELVLVATVGWVGVEPALAALRAGRHLALANKEVLVCAGDLVMEEARQRQLQILPVDSEHNAIYQCLSAGDAKSVRRLILTCSGGPFRKATREEIDRATADITLRHPTWDMGSKISVDSATLMNKGFEVIEAHHLFRVPYDKIEVVVHPQSIIHSMVEYVDGSIMAQLGHTDMRLPIQFVLTWPERRPTSTPPLDFGKLATLSFEVPDHERFPALMMAYNAGRQGGTAPCVLNAANEIAVQRHLAGSITCGTIPKLLGQVMAKHGSGSPDPSLEELHEADRWAREYTSSISG